MKKMILIVCTLFAAGAMTSAQAQFAKAEDAIKYRKSALTVMGTHFYRIAAMVQGKVPFDAKAAAENAEIVANMSKLPWAAFGEGTDAGDTKAKPEIWKDGAKFKAAAEKLQVESAKLLLAAQSGKEDAIKAAFGATGSTCKACHDDFRSK
jgi:cytochrome c556